MRTESVIQKPLSPDAGEKGQRGGQTLTVGTDREKAAFFLGDELARRD